MYTKTLIIGADGMIGSRLFSELKNRHMDVLGTSRKNPEHIPFDLQYPEKIDLPVNIGTAFICAAITGTGICRENPDYTNQINVENTSKLIKFLVNRGIHVVTLSSDAAFLKNTEYGKQKHSLEKKLANISTLIRIGKVFDTRENIFMNWFHKLKEGLPVTAFDNLFFAPVLLDNLTDHLISLIDRKIPEKIWITSTPWTSYYQALRFLAHHFGYDKNLIGAARTKNPNQKPHLFPGDWNYLRFDTYDNLIRLYEKSYQGVV